MNGATAKQAHTGFKQFKWLLKTLSSCVEIAEHCV